MKKKLPLFLLFGCLFFACSKKSENYVIDIDLKNTGNRLAIAMHEIPDKGISADTLVPNGDFFRIRGNSDSLAVVSFYLADGRPPFRFYVKNGDRIEIKGDLNDPASLRITGEPVNQEVFRFRKQQAEQPGRQLYPEGVHFLSPPLPYLPDKTRRELWEAAAAFVTEHSASPAATIVFSEYMLYPPFVRKNDSLLSTLGPEARSSLLMRKIRHFQETAGAGIAGSQAPSFVLKNDKGQPVSSDTLSGKTAIIGFWSAGNDQNNFNRSVERLYNLYRDSVLWINIAVDMDSARWLERLRREPPAGVQLRAGLGWNTPVVREYGVVTLPDLYLIDKEGKIEAGRLSVAQLENHLKNKFGNRATGNR